MPSATSGSNGYHEALNPIHPDMLHRLDPKFIEMYNEHVANTPNQPIDLKFLREKYSTIYSYGTGPAPEVGRIYDCKVPVGNNVEVDVRVYEPNSPGPWPVHIDYHGGGWGLGDLDTEAHICRHICHEAEVAVIDVAYRLVPENPFPTGVEDSFAVLKYVFKYGAEKFNINPNSISIGGVSAGGNISLVCSHWARDAGVPLRLVIVGTPTIDDLSQYASASESPYRSMQENEHAPTLNWMRLAWFDRLKWSSLSKDPAVEKQQRERIGWVKNLMEAPNFDMLPRTVIYTAGADPLRDEGEAYAMKLVAHGVEVVMKRFLGVPHPFMHMDGALRQGSEFIELTASEIRLAHSLNQM